MQSSIGGNYYCGFWKKNSFSGDLPIVNASLSSASGNVVTFLQITFINWYLEPHFSFILIQARFSVHIVYTQNTIRLCSMSFIAAWIY